MRTVETLLGGQWVDSGEWIDVHDPADLRAPAFRVPALTPEDVTRAYDAAEAGAVLWRRTSPIERSAVLGRAAGLLRERIEEIAADVATENGKTRAEARGEALKAADFLEYYGLLVGRGGYGTLLHDVRPDTRTSAHQEPLGVVLAITPWNDPLITPARKLAPALAAYNAAVLKPATETPVSGLHLARALHDAGLPAACPERHHRPHRRDQRGAARRPAHRRGHLHRRQRGRRPAARAVRHPQHPLPGRTGR